MDTLGWRIKARMKEIGLNQTQVAERLRQITPDGKGTQGLISQLIRGGNENSKYLNELATVLNTTRDELLYGYDEKSLNSKGDNVSPLPAPRCKTPVISLVQAGSWRDVDDPYHPGEADEWVRVESKVSKSAFALRIDGDSMTSNIGDSFPHGCIVIFDPDRSPKAGDYVVAKDTLRNMATFKKLTTDGSRWYLKPLNPAYPAIEIDDPSIRVIAVATEWQMAGKL